MCVTIDCGFEFPFLARNKMFIIIVFIAKFGMPILHANNGILEILTCQFGKSNFPILESINLPTLDITKLANFGNYRTCPFWKFYKLTKFGLIILPILVAIKASSFETPN